MRAHPHAVPTSAVPSVGDMVSGKYRVDGTAGSGGMGVVLSATHVELGHRVAIKVLASEDNVNEQAVERFIREGKAAACLESDHVVRIYDVGRLDSGAPFMIMELLRGEDLGTHVIHHGPIEYSLAVDWLLQACNAIAEAHANGIVHRDLKPANLFLTKRSDGSDCVKVLDFGISKWLASAKVAPFQSDLTAPRQVVGSPAYMSPEQVRNSREIDHRVDIWALGMTLYEFLAGKPAFCADTFPAVCAAIIADSPASICSLVPAVPKELDQIVLRCLEKDPARRFASVDELVMALLPFAPAHARSTRRTGRQSAPRPNSAWGVAQATLTSAQSSNNAEASGPRGIDPSRSLVNRTLRSGERESSRPAVSTRTRSLRLTSKRSIWLLLGVVGFALGVTWKMRNITPHQESTQGQAVPADAARFTLRFESQPTGANVWEGNRHLGVTPLEYEIENTAVAHQPRTFTLRADHYMPFTITQGSSTRNVVVTAHLASAPQQLEQATVNPAPSAHASARPGRHGPVSVAKGGTSTKAAETLPIDIRTQR